METTSGIYRNLEGTTTQLISKQIVRELAFDSTLDQLRYLDCSGIIYYIPTSGQVNSYISNYVTSQMGIASGLVPLNSSRKIDNSYFDINISGITGGTAYKIPYFDSNSILSTSGKCININPSTGAINISGSISCSSSINFDNNNSISAGIGGMTIESVDGTINFQDESASRPYIIFDAVSNNSVNLYTDRGIENLFFKNPILTIAAFGINGSNIPIGELYKIDGVQHTHTGSNITGIPSGEIVFGTGTGISSYSGIKLNTDGNPDRGIMVSGVGMHAHMDYHGFTSYNSQNVYTSISPGGFDLAEPLSSGRKRIMIYGPTNSTEAVNHADDCDYSLRIHGGINLQVGSTYNINGSPHTHTGSSITGITNGDIVLGAGNGIRSYSGLRFEDSSNLVLITDHVLGTKINLYNSSTHGFTHVMLHDNNGGWGAIEHVSSGVSSHTDYSTIIEHEGSGGLEFWSKGGGFRFRQADDSTFMMPSTSGLPGQVITRTSSNLTSWAYPSVSAIAPPINLSVSNTEANWDITAYGTDTAIIQLNSTQSSITIYLSNITIGGKYQIMIKQPASGTYLSLVNIFYAGMSFKIPGGTGTYIPLTNSANAIDLLSIAVMSNTEALVVSSRNFKV